MFGGEEKAFAGEKLVLKLREEESEGKDVVGLSSRTRMEFCFECGRQE